MINPHVRRKGLALLLGDGVHGAPCSFDLDHVRGFCHALPELRRCTGGDLPLESARLAEHHAFHELGEGAGENMVSIIMMMDRGENDDMWMVLMDHNPSSIIIYFIRSFII
jgi:hypothetical protein